MMRRRVFTLGVVISLLLCVATVALWVRSYWYGDSYDFGRDGGSSHDLRSLLGNVHLVSDFAPGSRRVGSETHFYTQRLSPQAVWNGGRSGYPPQPQWHLGCIWQSYARYHMPFGPTDKGFITQHRLIVVPYRWIALMFAFLPAVGLIVIVRSRRSRRATDSRCRTCGYDLRATPQRCPECGTVPQKATTPVTSHGNEAE